MKTHLWLCEDYADNNEGYSQYLTNLALQIERDNSREKLVELLCKQANLVKIKECTNRDESKYDYSEDNYKLVEFSHEDLPYTLMLISDKKGDLAVAHGSIDDVYEFLDDSINRSDGYQ